VPFGGVFRIGEMVLQHFREAVLSTSARSKIVEPRFEPAVGAVLLALNEIGVAIDAQIIAGIERSSIQFPAIRLVNGGVST
jgi:hypothetical protein